MCPLCVWLALCLLPSAVNFCLTCNFALSPPRYQTGIVKLPFIFFCFKAEILEVNFGSLVGLRPSAEMLVCVICVVSLCSLINV